jgi:hypothetical protein
MKPDPAITVLNALQTILDKKEKIEATYEWPAKWSKKILRPIGSKKPKLAEKDQIAVWELYRQWAITVEPKCKFNRDGIGNSSERKRRRFLATVFFLVDFDSTCDQCKELFQKSIGRVSLKELMFFPGKEMPTWYFEWAFAVLPVTKITFGPDALAGFKKSLPHLATFSHLDKLKRDILMVNRIMTS